MHNLRSRDRRAAAPRPPATPPRPAPAKKRASKSPPPAKAAPKATDAARKPPTFRCECAGACVRNRGLRDVRVQLGKQTGADAPRSHVCHHRVHWRCCARWAAGAAPQRLPCGCPLSERGREFWAAHRTEGGWQ